MGVIKNMQDYITEFNTVNLPVDDIIQFVQKVRPEAWNPAWKQSQVDNDIYQFWLGADFTFEAAYYETYAEQLNVLSQKDKRMNLAIESRISVQ